MEGKAHSNKDGLPIHFVNNAAHDCHFKRSYERRKAWRRALILILVVFFASKLLFGWFAFSPINNKFHDEDQFLWVEVLEPSTDNVVGDCYTSPRLHSLPGFPISPKCEPNIKWDGPSELLIDPTTTSGLIFRVKGLFARGSVTIRQDSQSKGSINITNSIYIGSESLQEKIDVKINAPNNWITVNSLDNVDFAYVNLKTSNGHIRINSLTAANADISTVNGHVNGAVVVGENLEVRSINGPIHLTATPNPLSDSVFVGLSSFNGNLNIKVDELMKTQKIDLKGHSVNGGIIASIPETYRGNFLASSATGYAYVEGEGITFEKDTRNHKEGYKGKINKKHNCKYNKLGYNSNVNLTVVTGASELYFP
ncbi:8257_t:CDS:2 [Entrophospora sp. SA101]|nr:8257_t:CDS:2 [Entrophospora sp. SA101]